MGCTCEAERNLWSKGLSRVAGIDEAGRGPLAGPVVAAAVILSPNFSLDGINDSKQLTESFREELFASLSEPESGVIFGIGVVSAAEIDRINILQATYLAMKRAAAALTSPPEHLLQLDTTDTPFRHTQTRID